MARSPLPWVFRACALRILEPGEVSLRACHFLLASLLVHLILPVSATAQVLIGPGPGGTVPIEYIEATGTRTIEAFPGFFGGTSVTLGDVNGDGPHVRVFSGTDLSDIASFHAFDPAFPCGVHVVAGDLNGAGAPRAGGVRQ